ncbi:MAG: hypothetical protein ACHQ53_12580, partial [Polyangiales bacterium]
MLACESRTAASSRSWALALLLGVLCCSCSSKSHGGSKTGAADGGGAADGSVAFKCLKDLVRCEGTVAKVCDGKGGYKSSVDCAKHGQPCVNSRFSTSGTRLTLGCVQCVPGEASCADGQAKLCREDGSGFDGFDCDPMQGMTCEPDGCKGVCAPPEVTTSYIGCDYYPTVTLNPVWSGFDFAIAVSNASDQPADVIVTRGDATVRMLTIAVDALEIIKLDWVAELKGGDQDACQVPPEPGDSRVVKQGAYRL